MRRIAAVLALLPLALCLAEEPAPSSALAPVPPAATAAPTAFVRPGELIELRMSYGLLGTAGTTTIETFAAPSPAGPRFRIHVTTQSRGLVDTLYPIANDSESILDAATGRPLTLTTKGRSGRRLTEKLTTFDYEKGQAVHVNVVRPQHNTTVPLPAEPAYDLMVALLQTREWRLRPGESRRVQCVNDEEFFTIEVAATGTERVKTPAGTFNTIVLEPRPVGEPVGFFKKGGALKLWISTDERPQIVRMDTRMKIGTVVAVLTRTATAPSANAATPPPASP